MRSDDGAVDIVKGPVKLAIAIGLRLESLKDSPEDIRLLPAVEAAGHRPPGTIALGQIPPRGSSAQAPQQAIEEGALVMGGSPSRWFLGWEQGFEPLPLLIRQVSSVHTQEYTAQNRVCQHALVLQW